jgi:hypothetical protein
MASLFSRVALVMLLPFAVAQPALAGPTPPPSPAASAPAASASPAPGPTVDPAVTAKAKEWLHRFQTGDIDRTQLEPAMSTAITGDIIKQLKDELSPLGDPQSFKILSQQSLGEGITAYVYRVTFKSSAINEIIAIDKDGKIEGFRLTPVQ